MIEKTAPEIARPVKKCQENLPEGVQLYYWINVDLEKEIESYFVYISNGEQLSNVKFEYKVLQGKWVFSTYDLPALDQILSYDHWTLVYECIYSGNGYKRGYASID